MHRSHYQQDEEIARLIQTGAIEVIQWVSDGEPPSEEHALVDLGQPPTAALGLRGWGIVTWVGTAISMQVYATKRAADAEYALAISDMGEEQSDE
jgi:hypothetical protein